MFFKKLKNYYSLSQQTNEINDNLKIKINLKKIEKKNLKSILIEKKSRKSKNV